MSLSRRGRPVFLQGISECRRFETYIVCERLHAAGKPLLVRLQPAVPVPPAMSVEAKLLNCPGKVSDLDFPVVEPAVVDVDVGVAGRVVPVGHEQVGHLPKQPLAARKKENRLVFQV